MSLLDEKKFAQESVLRFAHNELIFSEGDESREMFVVRRGEVLITKKSPRGEVELARLKKGDFLGEMSLLESLPRSATARANGETELLAIHPGGFLLKIRRDPTFAFEIMQSLSRRIRITNDVLVRELANEGLKSASISRILTQSEFEKSEDVKS